MKTETVPVKIARAIDKAGGGWFSLALAVVAIQCPCAWVHAEGLSWQVAASPVPVVPGPASSAVTEARPEWLRFSLGRDSFLTEIYRDSIAEAIFVPTTKRGFLPPVQYLNRPTTEDLKTEGLGLARSVLKNMGVDPDAATTILLKRPKPFKTGPDRDLPGWAFEYQSLVDGNSYRTCLVVVNERERMHALYVHAYFTDLRKCERLEELSRSPVLFEEAPPHR